MDADRWKRIDALLDAVFQLEPDKREAFLDKVCAGDEALRKELTTLIAADERGQSFLKEPAVKEVPGPSNTQTAFASGTLLNNRYEITAPIGAGGMGEVYRARDPRIGRSVAIKVLPGAASMNEDRLRRFKQEARAIGQLNHPNILAIYDIGDEDGHPFIVSELLEGETLRLRMRTGALPQKKAIEFALQIAHGLAAAHEKGIVHRDLKPENIFITKEGRVKILDFGLAKLIHPEMPASEATEASTVSRLTETGVVLGTVVYMSPEQVRGEPVDHRSDIFAFGAVLYEMLSGKRAFSGTTNVEVMNAILKEDPPEIPQTGAALSPVLLRMIQRCLEKDADRRFQSTSDLAFALESVSTSEITSLQMSSPPGKARAGKVIYLAITFLCFLAALFFGYGYFHQTSHPAVRLSIPPPESSSFNTVFSGVALSPDGRNLAFAAINGERELWLRTMDSETPIKLPDTQGAYSIFWSPDGRFLGFFTTGKLKKIEISSGVVQSICDAPDGRGGTWNRDGAIIFAPNSGGPLYRVSASGGPVTPVTALRKNETGHKWPSFLPDGKHFLYVAQSAEGKKKGSVYVASMDSKSDKLLLEDVSNAIYAPPGYLIFARGLLDATLLAQRFNKEQFQLEGEPVKVASKISYNYLGNIAPFSVSDNGVLVYQRGLQIPSQLTWLDRKNNNIQSIEPSAIYSSPRFSPDGRKIVMNRFDPQTEQNDVWIYDAQQKRFTRFTTDGGLKQREIWSPDGAQIAYASEQNGKSVLYQKASAGGVKEVALLETDDFISPIDWAPNGGFIAYDHQDPESLMDIWILPLTGDRKPFPFVQSPAFEMDGYFSPNGRWVAYTSRESGRPEIYVRPFPINPGQWQVSSSGGYYPRWSKDGKEMFYISLNNELMSVEIEPGQDFQTSPPKVLSRLPELTDFDSSYDVSPDHQHFVFFVFTSKPESVPLTVVLNWQSELKNNAAPK